jgi:broad specificity phosphatase PhoE
MDRLVLARHGESVRSVGGLVNGDAAVPAGLTEAGRAQAARLEQMIAEEQFDLAVTSGFPRTIETADIALAARIVPRAIVPDLNDLNFGSFENESLAQYRAWVVAHGPAEAPPGGESRAAAVERWVRGFRGVLRKPGRQALVVCHGMPIRYLLAAASGATPTPIAEDVAYAEPSVMNAPALVGALDLLAGWCAAPGWPVAR